MSSEHLAQPQWQPEQNITDDSFIERSLADLGLTLRDYPLPKDKYNYPDFSERLFVADRIEAERLILDLPSGPWEIDSTLPTPEESTDLASRGFTLDSKGRPIHPWLSPMLTDPTVGVLTGKGFLYHWGENETADPIIIANGRILLIQRDNGQWALPGGFVDPGEDSRRTAGREAGEEANIDPERLPEPDLVYSGPVADLRATAHAWTKTNAYCYHLLNEVEPPSVEAGDDANDAGWFPLETAAYHMLLYGSHNALIQRAVQLDPSLLV